MTPRNAFDAGTLKPGEQLQQARLQQNFSLEYISQALRVNRGILKALEANDYSQPLGQGYWRGHLRRYAEYLQLDPRPLIAYLEQEGILTAIGLKQTERLGVFSRGRKPHGFRSPRLILLALFLAFIAWGWVGPGQSSFKKVLEATPFASLQDYFPNLERHSHPPRVELATSASVAQHQNETSLAIPPLSVPSSAVERAKQEEIATPSVIEAPLPETVNSTGTEALQLSFKEECWVTVVDKSGKTLISGLKQSGELVSLIGKAPFKLVLGNVENVSIIRAGTPVDLSQYEGHKVVRLTLE